MNEKRPHILLGFGDRNFSTKSMMAPDGWKGQVVSQVIIDESTDLYQAMAGVFDLPPNEMSEVYVPGAGLLPGHEAPGMDLSDCPYYRGVLQGVCGYSCRDEPSCQVDEPEGGWPRRWTSEQPELPL